ncbi:MAG: hypothetical protein H3C48_04400 [Chitinophagaceae bacterium]|nr:hypothetical protein [Chitinophagaceae bacterium]
MKKFFIILFVLAGSFFFASAQVTEAVVDFNRTKRTVKSMEINESPSVVEQAIRNRMLTQGFKSNDSKGWLVFKGINNPDFSEEPCDLYMKVEKKSRKEKETSVVYFFASKPNEHATPVELSAEMLSSDGFQSQIAVNSEVEKLERDIKEQEKTTEKSQKKYDDLVKEQSTLERKIKDLQSDLEKNKQKQAEQLQDLDNQKRVLDQLKSKRGA